MRSFGRWPASVVGAVLVCFGGGGIAMIRAGGLATVFAIDAHANSLITAAVVGAALVWIIPRVAELSRRRLVTAAVVLGVIGGLPLAGDNLYLAWGLAPLLVVTVLAAWRGPEDGAGRVVAIRTRHRRRHAAHGAHRSPRSCAVRACAASRRPTTIS